MSSKRWPCSNSSSKLNSNKAVKVDRSLPVPRTSARRGKRRKATHGCRRCKREWRFIYRCMKDDIQAKRTNQKSKLGKSPRFYCNGKYET